MRLVMIVIVVVSLLSVGQTCHRMADACQSVLTYSRPNFRLEARSAVVESQVTYHIIVLYIPLVIDISQQKQKL